MSVTRQAAPVTGARRVALSRRVAAAAALLALAAAVALVLIGVIRNWAGVAIVLVAVLAGVTAAWIVLSRRGPVRWTALAAVVVAAGLLAWGFVLADFHPLRIAVVTAAAVVSVTSAQVALRGPAAHPVPGGGATHPVPGGPVAGPVLGGPAAQPGPRRVAVPVRRPRNAVLIMNPTSGGGKVARYHLVDECTARGIEPVILHRGDNLLQLAEDLIARGADVIGMAGGDGSQALVASVAARHKVPHVVVPAGTRNHFALDLGLDRDDVVGALSAFTEPAERRIDLAEVNGRVFVNNASLGLYAKIVQSPEYRDAKLKTAAGLLPAFLGPDADPVDLRFAGPTGAAFATADLILVSNDPYQLDHIGGRGTRERLDLGTLGIVAARIDGAAAARRFVALEAAGQVRRFEGWLEWQAGRFELSSGGTVEIALDGESLSMDPPLVFASRPGVLRVRLPRTAAASPAARALRLASRATVAELTAIAAGHGR